jgi:hypothetical protein
MSLMKNMIIPQKNILKKDINMANSSKVPKKTLTEHVEEKQNVVNQLMSFVDWIRYVFDWLKGLIGR